jgi:cell division septal protein FtsQ
MVRCNYKKPHRAKRKKPFWTKPVFWRSLFLSVSGAATVWLVCFSPVFEVKEIEIAGAEKIEEKEFVGIIEKELNKKIGLFDSKSILLFNLDQVKKELLARLPQAQDIKIEREFPSKIIASVRERRAAAAFFSGDKFYSLDEAGIAFEERAADDDLIKITAVNAVPVLIGESAIEKEILIGILRAASEMRAGSDIGLAEAIVASPERVNLRTKEGWYIYFNPRKDVENQMTKLFAVLSEGSFKEKRPNLEYVDVRFTRVYLKGKDKQNEQSEQ